MKSNYLLHHYTITCFYLLFCCSLLQSQAQNTPDFSPILSGQIQTDEADSTIVLPYVNVYVKSTAIGTVADEQGQFSLSIPDGKATVTFSLLGYEPLDFPIDISENTVMTIKLKPSTFDLDAVVVAGEKTNIAKEVIRKVMNNTANVLNKEVAYSHDAYLQTNMDKWIKKSPKDTIEIEEGFQPVYLNESFARQHHKGGKFKRVVKAELKQTGDAQLKRWATMGIDNSFKGANMATTYNPLEYFRNPQEVAIDLYDRQITNPSLADRPVTSPLGGTGAFVNYKYQLTNIEVIENDTIYTIQVAPIFKQSPLFSGTLVVTTKDGYYLKSADLSIPKALTSCQNFRMKLDYDWVDSTYWRPVFRQFTYEAKIGGNRYQVETLSKDSDFDSSPDFDKNFFNNELVVYEASALERDTAIWQKIRPVQLNTKQMQFFEEQDSIWNYRHSDEYYRKQDSIFNRLTWLSLFVEGFGWRRRSKGIEFRFNPLLESIEPFGVGGLRQNLGGSITRTFKSANELSLRYLIDYGYLNEDLKGEIELNYMYLPRKFARFYGRIGDTYNLITLNQPVLAILSRSNFIRNERFGFGHSFEVHNGIYLTTEFNYADKQPIDNLEFADWSNELFGELNTPTDFERYKSLIVEAQVLLKFRQKYITRGREKIIIGTSFPTLALTYRKGIPNIGGSEVNFDQIELNAYYKAPPTKLGSTNWDVKAGSFISKKSLRPLEHRFIRGSDPYFFSSPLENLQLLGPTLSTPNPYLQAALVHHFDGFFLDKVPLLSRLQMETIVGASVLTIPDQSFAHFEMYAGVGKKFRLFGEQVQIAAYALTADNTFDKLSVSYKIGFNFFDPFAKQWLY